MWEVHAIRKQDSNYAKKIPLVLYHSMFTRWCTLQGNLHQCPCSLNINFANNTEARSQVIIHQLVSLKVVESVHDLSSTIKVSVLQICDDYMISQLCLDFK